MNRKLLGRIGINVLGLLVFAVMTFPVYWMVATSFKEGRNPRVAISIFAFVVAWNEFSSTGRSPSG
jgi:ABC-type glycerol-3-phosphate transport system permease component